MTRAESYYTPAHSLAEKTYTGKLLTILLVDVQLFLLFFPFSSFFDVIPALRGLEGVVNAVSSLTLGLSVVYIFLMRKPYISVRHCTFFFLFVAYLVASTLWSFPSMASNSSSFIIRTVLSIVQTFVIVVICLEKEDYLFSILKRLAIIISLLSFVFIIVFPGLATWTTTDVPRVRSFFSSPNNMGQFVAFAFLIINFYRRESIYLPALLLLNAILLYQFIKCDSMTSLGGICIILVCYHFKDLLKPLFVFIVITGLAIPHLNKLSSNGASAAEFFGRDLTFTGRTGIWNILLADLDNRDREAFGFGAGGYWMNDSEAFNPLTTLSELDFDPGQGHNGYLDLIMMGGVAGLILFLVFLYHFVKKIFQKTKAKHRVLYFLTLIIMFNNMTESSFFRMKHFYFVLLMLVFWQVYLAEPDEDAIEESDEMQEVRSANYS